MSGFKSRCQDRQVEVDKSNIVYGMAVVGAAPSNDDAEDDSMAATKVVKSGQRVSIIFYHPTILLYEHASCRSRFTLQTR